MRCCRFGEPATPHEESQRMRSYASATKGSVSSAWSAMARISGRSADTDVQHALHIKDHWIGLRYTYDSPVDSHPYDRCDARFDRRRCCLNRNRRVLGHIKSAVVIRKHTRARRHFRHRSRLSLPFSRQVRLGSSADILGRATPPPAPSTLLSLGQYPGVKGASQPAPALIHKRSAFAALGKPR